MIGAAPFYFGATMAFLTLLLFVFWKSKTKGQAN
jgi:hypothetical protein